MSEYIQVVTTTSSAEEARKIADALVQRRLAACVQIVGPVTSVYRWEGKVETATEWQCLVKSRRDLLERLIDAIQGLHSYQVPEILALPVLGGSAAYLGWLDAETREAE